MEYFPASDKSFSRLLGEAPFLPESTLKILNDLCYSDVIDHDGKIARDIGRVIQAIGAPLVSIFVFHNNRLLVEILFSQVPLAFDQIEGCMFLTNCFLGKGEELCSESFLYFAA